MCFKRQHEYILNSSQIYMLKNFDDSSLSEGICHCLFLYLYIITFYTINKIHPKKSFKCDAIKQNESEVKKIHFLLFSIFYWGSIHDFRNTPLIQWLRFRHVAEYCVDPVASL